MIRQARGLSADILENIARITEDFRINCFFHPGHMGHKDAAESPAVMRMLCQRLGIPFLATPFFETIQFE